MRGLDVFRDEEFLHAQCEFATAQHWAPNCATFSRALEIPIPGVRFPPQPKRSDEFPEGLPKMLSHEIHGPRILNDTKMAHLAAKMSLSAHRAGKLFSLEHTGNSIALKLSSWIELMNQPGVIVDYYHGCMFEPGDHLVVEVSKPKRVTLI